MKKVDIRLSRLGPSFKTGDGDQTLFIRLSCKGARQDDAPAMVEAIQGFEQTWQELAAWVKERGGKVEP